MITQHSVDVMGVMEGGGVKEGDLGDVGKFLNRLLGLKLLEQNMVSRGSCSIEMYGC